MLQRLLGVFYSKKLEVVLVGLENRYTSKYTFSPRNDFEEMRYGDIQCVCLGSTVIDVYVCLCLGSKG